MATGVFTVPSGGEGLYYFSIFMAIQPQERGLFEIHVNNEAVCTSIGDMEVSGPDIAQATCSAVVDITDGN